MRRDEGMDTDMDAAETDALRAGTWTLLGRLLTEPPSAALRQRLAEVGASGDDADPLAAAWARLAAAARSARDDALKREFHDVFVGVGGGEVNPYASWYLAGALADRPLVELRGELEALGVVRRDGCSEPEDHAAAVCETMALAILDEAVDAAWQQVLFTRHADSWMGRFFDDLEQAPSAHFYRAVAALGRAFLALERRFHAMPA